jgi:NAD(P)-dependent dehydrogenase (short-subunit alcohol dehydrogenase family)
MKTLTILITGATSGIGRATALHLAERGHHVIATGRNEGALATLRAEARGRLDTLPLDVTDKASIAAAMKAATALSAGIDVLVNNAGFGVLGPTEAITEEDMRAQYETNVFGLMAMTRAVLPMMRARGAGRIVNVSSLGGRFTLPLFGVYNSTKFAVESLSDALRIELAPFGIRVSLIEPGVIATNFTDRSMSALSKYDHPDSPYAPVLAQADRIRASSERTAVGPRCVARAIEKAATARRPRARYVAPFIAGLGVGFLRALPTRVADFIMAQVMGLTRRRLLRRLPAPAAVAAMVVLALAVPGTSRADDSGPRWETVRSEDGIIVSRKEIPGSSFIAFRGEGDVNAPIGRVGSVLVDVAREKEWVDSVVEARTLRKVSETEYIVYSHASTPPPLSDRDFVADVTLSVDPARKAVVIRMHSVDDATAPRTSYVRGDLEDSSFTMTSIEGGAKTHVVAEIHCDPRGSVPSFMVNFFQKNWGYKTLTSLRKQVAKADVADNAAFVGFLHDKAL